MDTIHTCTKCGAQLSSGAKFCDQCGASLTAANDSAPVAQVNWLAIIAIALVIAVFGWLLFGKDSGSLPAGDGSSANPHGESGTMSGAADGMGGGDNPHGGMDSSASGMPDIEALKARLDIDPLDTEALYSLYQTYGIIGRGSQITPYLETAVAEAEAQKDELGDELETTIVNLAMSAMIFGNDMDGAEIAALKALELAPDSIAPLKILGDVGYWRDDYASAIEWYDKYFVVASPEERQSEYWYATANRGEMYLLAAEAGDSPMSDLAVADLTLATEQLPTHFPAWLNLGRGLLLLGDEAEAERIWEETLPLATSEHDSWKVEAALAELRGEEIPAEPVTATGMPGSGMGGGMSGGMGSGAANPHGGTMSSPESGSGDNPHGG